MLQGDCVERGMEEELYGAPRYETEEGAVKMMWVFFRSFLRSNYISYVVREESRHREKKGGSRVTARARERERRRYSM